MLNSSVLQQKLSEVDDIKKSLDFLSEEVSAVRLQQKGILTLVEEVKALRIQNAENDRKIVFLENRVADLEQYTRMNDIIITGLDIKSRSYARAVATTNGEESEDLDVRSTEQQVAAFLQTRGIELDCDWKLKHADHPWITKGLQNACKKKNTLYRERMRQRTKDEENRYKKYKNKLTNIIRIARKEYYSKLLDNTKKHEAQEEVEIR